MGHIHQHMNRTRVTTFLNKLRLPRLGVVPLIAGRSMVGLTSFTVRFPDKGSATHRGSEPTIDGMERVLIVGAGSGGQVLANELRDNARWKLWPVGFIDDDNAKIGRTINGLPVLGDSDAIPALVQSENIDVVVIAVPSASSADYSRITGIAQSTRARVLTMPPIGSILRGDSQVTTLRSVRPVDVLGRPVVDPDRESCLQFIRGKRVLVTGAAGSIGAELATQIAALDPAHLVLLDTNETGLHDLVLDIRRRLPQVPVEMVIASVTDSRRLG